MNGSYMFQFRIQKPFLNGQSVLEIKFWDNMSYISFKNGHFYIPQWASMQHRCHENDAVNGHQGYVGTHLV